MGDVSPLVGSEQLRLVKMGEGHYSETWLKAVGFNLAEGNLKPIIE